MIRGFTGSRIKLQHRRALLSWASVAALAVLCAALGLLQYRWIGEIAEAERARLREDLKTRLTALGEAVGPHHGRLACPHSSRRCHSAPRSPSGLRGGLGAVATSSRVRIRPYRPRCPSAGWPPSPHTEYPDRKIFSRGLAFRLDPPATATGNPPLRPRSRAASRGSV